jgi:hypothetical protein
MADTDMPSGPNIGQILSMRKASSEGDGGGETGGSSGGGGGGLDTIFSIGFGGGDVGGTFSAALGGSGTFKIFSFGLASLDDLMQSPLFQGFQFMSLDSLGKLPTPLAMVSLENLNIGKVGGKGAAPAA